MHIKEALWNAAYLKCSGPLKVEENLLHEDYLLKSKKCNLTLEVSPSAFWWFLLGIVHNIKFLALTFWLTPRPMWPLTSNITCKSVKWGLKSRFYLVTLTFDLEGRPEGYPRQCSAKIWRPYVHWFEWYEFCPDIQKVMHMSPPVRLSTGGLRKKKI